VTPGGLLSSAEQGSFRRTLAASSFWMRPTPSLSHRFRPDMLRILEHVGRQRTQPQLQTQPQTQAPISIAPQDPSSAHSLPSSSGSSQLTGSGGGSTTPQEDGRYGDANAGPSAGGSPQAPARTERQTVLVSATMTGAVLEAASRWGCAPMLVQCAPQGHAAGAPRHWKRHPAVCHCSHLCHCTHLCHCIRGPSGAWGSGRRRGVHGGIQAGV